MEGAGGLWVTAICLLGLLLIWLPLPLYLLAEAAERRQKAEMERAAGPGRKG